MSVIRNAKEFFCALGPDNVSVRSVLRVWCSRYKARLRFSGDYIEVAKGSRAIRVAKRHMPYVLDMASAFDHYFTPIVPESLNGRAVVDYSRPRLQQYSGSGLQFELSSIPEEASAIEGYFSWYEPKEGDTIFDVGAYCGVSTYHFASVVGNAGHVYAFEPDPENYSRLLCNIERHQIRNVTAIPLGIAGENGSATFQCEGALGSGLARVATRPAAGSTMTIQTVTLEEACRRYGVPHFVKVDIEGAEVEMLEAAKTFLKSNAIQFAFDTNHRLNGVLTCGAVERILRECGYEVLSSTEPGFMTTWARKAVRELAQVA